MLEARIKSTQTIMAKATIKDGKLIIELPINAEVPVSKSGRTRILAGTSGFESAGLEFRGHDVKVSINVTVPLDCPTSDKKKK